MPLGVFAQKSGLQKSSPAELLAERQRREVEAECARVGVAIERRGQLFLLTGRGVDIRVTDLRHVLPDDFADMHRQRSNAR